MHIILTDTNIGKNDVLEENSSEKKWRVLRKHADWPKGWIITHGGATRLIFPADMNQYSLVLED